MTFLCGNNKQNDLIDLNKMALFNNAIHLIIKVVDISVGAPEHFISALVFCK